MVSTYSTTMSVAGLKSFIFLLASFMHTYFCEVCFILIDVDDDCVIFCQV